MIKYTSTLKSAALSAFLIAGGAATANADQHDWTGIYVGPHLGTTRLQAHAVDVGRANQIDRGGFLRASPLEQCAKPMKIAMGHNHIESEA